MFVFRVARSLWNLTGTSAENFKAMRKLNYQSRGFETSRYAFQELCILLVRYCVLFCFVTGCYYLHPPRLLHWYRGIMWLPNCQWNKPDKYGYWDPMNSPDIYDIITKSNTQQNRVHVSWNAMFVKMRRRGKYMKRDKGHGRFKRKCNDARA